MEASMITERGLCFCIDSIWFLNFLHIFRKICLYHLMFLSISHDLCLSRIILLIACRQMLSPWTFALRHLSGPITFFCRKPTTLQINHKMLKHLGDLVENHQALVFCMGKLFYLKLSFDETQLCRNLALDIYIALKAFSIWFIMIVFWISLIRELSTSWNHLLCCLAKQELSVKRCQELMQSNSVNHSHHMLQATLV